MKKSTEIKIKNLQQQEKLNIQALDAEYSEHASSDAKDKKAKPEGLSMIIAKLLSFITLPLIILLLLPTTTIFTEKDSDSSDEKFSVSRRLR